MGLGYDLKTLFQHNYFLKDEAIENIFNLIKESIAVAARQNMNEFLARREEIIEAILCEDDDEISHKRLVVHQNNLDHQFVKLINHDQVMFTTLKPINIRPKGFGIIQPKASVGEKKTSFQQVSSEKRIRTEEKKRKIDATSKGDKKGSLWGEVKFEATKRKFEETSQAMQKAKRRMKFVDCVKLPQPNLIVDERKNRFGKSLKGL